MQRFRGIFSGECREAHAAPVTQREKRGKGGGQASRDHPGGGGAGWRPSEHMALLKAFKQEARASASWVLLGRVEGIWQQVSQPSQRSRPSTTTEIVPSQETLGKALNQSGPQLSPLQTERLNWAPPRSHSPEHALYDLHMKASALFGEPTNPLRFPPKHRPCG